MLPSKIQLQLLPQVKVSGKVRGVGKHAFIFKPSSLHYGVTDLVDRPDVYHRRILVDKSLLCTSERLRVSLFKQTKHERYRIFDVLHTVDTRLCISLVPTSTSK